MFDVNFDHKYRSWLKKMFDVNFDHKYRSRLKFFFKY